MPTVDERLRQELSQALRAGPFSAALHLAIEARGMTLDQVQQWLAERGVRLSVATLSYWRRGRSRPEKPESLRAVHLLEELLEVPGEGLISLLGPRRARGRWLGHRPGNLAMSQLFADERPDQLLDGVGAPQRGALSRLSTQVTVLIDADRLVTAVRMRELLRANVDRVFRCGVVYSADEQPDLPPDLVDASYCRVGRVSADRTVGLVAGELILDRMLEAGEPALVEYEWRFSSPVRMVHYEHRFTEQTREFVLQVRFAAGAVPARCYRYDRRTATAPEGNRRELWIGGSNTALLTELDIPAGIVGMRWEWPA